MKGRKRKGKEGEVERKRKGMGMEGESSGVKKGEAGTIDEEMEEEKEETGDAEVCGLLKRSTKKDAGEVPGCEAEASPRKHRRGLLSRK